ncbi:MAG: class I SAM-dependent methyltransferase, partial [Planctomycetes bacterium]|nr:class I SAM-dependent methyltransferase [Planctomycetota bacterium]
ILLMNTWVHHHRQEFLRRLMPLALKTPGSSLWLVKRG